MQQRRQVSVGFPIQRVLVVQTKFRLVKTPCCHLIISVLDCNILHGVIQPLANGQNGSSQWTWSGFLLLTRNYVLIWWPKYKFMHDYDISDSMYPRCPQAIEDRQRLFFDWPAAQMVCHNTNTTPTYGALLTPQLFHRLHSQRFSSTFSRRSRTQETHSSLEIKCSLPKPHSLM
jgi:hypothetical protein